MHTESDRFVAGTLHVNDRPTLDAIARGDRIEISSGYRCRLEWTPGEFEGQRYDCIQRNIRYNHAALCPPNGGRAGNDVGLRLDGIDDHTWAIAHFDNEQETTTMAEPNKDKTITKLKLRLDGRDHEVEEYSKEHFDALDRLHTVEIETLKKTSETASAALQARLDSTAGERDTFKNEIEKLNLDLKETKKKAADDADASKEAEEKKVLKKVRTLRQIARLFGWAKDKDEEEKMDAMSVQELHILAIKKRDPKFDLTDKETGKPHSEDYIKSRYDSLVSSMENGNSVDNVAGVIRSETSRLDSSNSSLDASVKAMVDAQEEFAKKVNGATSAK